MAKEHIMVVDDESDIVELVRFNLTKNGYRVTSAENGEDALELFRKEPPDLLVLDLMLPGMDGLDVCRTLVKEPRFGSIPIIMLSARGDEADIVTGLEIGAADYITKPFSPRVLLARVRAALRQVGKEEDEHEPTAGYGSGVVRRHELRIDSGRRLVFVGEDSIELTFTEFGILSYLARRPGWVFTRNQIIDAVRGTEYPVTDRSVDVQIVNLRRKLGSAGEYIETVRGVGYRFKE